MNVFAETHVYPLTHVRLTPQGTIALEVFGYLPGKAEVKLGPRSDRAPITCSMFRLISSSMIRLIVRLSA